MGHQAITTRFIGATNTRGTHIRAHCKGGSIRMPYEHGWDLDRNHREAAQLLIAKLKWRRDGWAQGTLSSGIVAHVRFAADELAVQP